MSNLGKANSDSSSALDSLDIAQGFTTGSYAGGYVLDAVVLNFDTAPSGLTVQLATGVSASSAGTTVATLRNPSALAVGLLRFTAPASTRLFADTQYFVVVQGSGRVWSTDSTDEDAGAAAGWSIADEVHLRSPSSTGGFPQTSTADALKMRVDGRPARPGPAPSVSAVPLQPDRLSVSWPVPVRVPATDYDLRYYQGSADPADEADWIEAGEAGGHDHRGPLTKATITGLLPVTTYRVQVRPVLGENPGPWSASGSGRTEALAGAWGTAVQVLTGNVWETVGGNNALGDDDVAQGFTSAGHDLGYTVTGVDLRFASAPDPGVQVRLATGVSASSGGTAVATLRNPATLAAGLLSFAAPPHTTLDPDATYFVVVEGAAGSLSWTNSNREDGLLRFLVSNSGFTRTASSTGAWTGRGQKASVRVNGRPNVGDPPGAPAPPTLAAVPGSTAVTASWSPPDHAGSGITDYDLRYHEGIADPADEADWIGEEETTGLPDMFTADASTGATITGLKPSTAYRVQVRAESRGAPGPWSASASITTNAETGANGAPTRAKLGTEAEGCIANPGSAAMGTLTVTPNVLTSVGYITDASLCGATIGGAPRRSPVFIDPDGDDLVVTVEAVIPDNVRFISGTPLMDGSRDRFWIRAVAAGRATNVRVNLTATDPHGESASAWFNAEVNLYPNARVPRFDEMVGMRGFPQGVPVGRWLLPPASGGDMATRNETGQLPYFYAVSGLPPGLSFDPLTRAVTGTPTQEGSYTVTYTADDADAAYSLKGSPGAADLADAARQSFVVRVGAPAIELVQMVSAPTYDSSGDGSFDTYIEGDRILVDVQFTEAVEVAGTPRTAGDRAHVRLDLGPSSGTQADNQVLANLLEEDGELYGGRRLRFGYTVKAADTDPDGVWVQTEGADGTVVFVPAGLSLASVESGASVVPTFPGLPTAGAANAKVDGSVTSASVGPRPLSAETDAAGDTVTVTFSRALSTQPDLSGVSLPSYFSVRGAGVVGAGARGHYQHPNTVAVSGSTLILELNTPANASDTVTLSYENVGAGAWPLKDQSSPPKRVAGFTDLAVTNNSTGVAAPVPTSATAVGAALELVFDQRLDQDSRPPGSAFTVSAEDTDRVRRTIAGTGAAVAIDDAKVAVTLASAVAEGDLLSVSYSRPADSPLLAAAGSPAVASFEAFKVEGVYDSTAPKLLSKLANILENRQNDPLGQGKSKIMLYYDEHLDRTSVPAAGDFALSSDDSNAVQGAAVASVAVEDTAVVLTTTHWLKDNIDYTLAYTPGTAPIEDLAGNAAAAFTETVRSFAVGQPVLRGSTVAGTRLELNMVSPLNPAAVPPPSAFTLWEQDVVTGETELHEFTGGRIVSVAVNAWTAVLQLEYPVYPCAGETVFRVSYTLPSSGSERLQTAAGWGADGWTATKWRGQANDHALVTNARHGRCAEWLAGTYVGSVVLKSARAFARDRGEPNPAWFTVSASGGAVAVTGAAFDPNDPKALKLTLSREFAPGEIVTVNYRRPAGVAGLWDAAGNQLMDVANAPVPVPEAEGLAASFHGLPEAHDGSRLFGFEIRFSEEFRGLTLRALKEALQVTGGRLVDAKRTTRGENRRVTVRVRPSGDGDMTLTLPATTDCSAADAICASDGRKLQAAVSAAVAGPPEPLPVISIADARADEGATLEFQVTLDKAAAGDVTVDYDTADGSATAGADYTAASGTLTFAAGETSMTVSVALLHDTEDENDETVALRLSSPSGATIGDGEATGTVVNVPPLTASFHGLPDEHDGKKLFAFEVRFSEEFQGLRLTAFRAGALQVAAGRVVDAKRAVRGQNRSVTVRVRPSSTDDMTLTLLATTDCAAATAICTHDGRKLANTVTASVRGPVAVSVADAEAQEGVDAAVSFAVTLSRAASGAVEVDYATRDGTAMAGEDYTATRGTLAFAAGETSMTVEVPLLDDALDEGDETFTLKLTGARGATIADGDATGTIKNSDPLQRMWLSRFGRTVADHVTAAVADRLANPLTGMQVTVGGQSLDLAQMEDESWLDRTMISVARVLGVPGGSVPVDGGWPDTGTGMHDPPTLDRIPVRSITGRELLLGSSFHLAGDPGNGGAADSGLAAWGRVTTGGFDGEAPADSGSVRIDGEVTTGILGTDAKWGRVLAGIALSVSEGEGTFDQPGVDSGTIESTMTTGSPYARIDLNDRISAWGMAGLGTGNMTIVQQANAVTNQPERITRSDLSLRMAAVGGRGALLTSGGTGGMDLALRSDAFFVRTESEEVSVEGNTKADASRLRLILEGSRAFRMGSGAMLTPGLELGLRHDGGDAETGTGVELGGRISYANPETGLSLEANIRALVAHEDSSYEEWGASGALRMEPGHRGRGLSFSLAPTYGAPGSSVERLWSARDAGGLASGGSEFEPESRLEGEIGYGVGLLGDRFTGTPNMGFGLSDGGSREYRIGWRLARAGGGSSGSSGLFGSFALSLDATRSEPGNGNDSGAAPTHAVVFQAGMSW